MDTLTAWWIVAGLLLVLGGLSVLARRRAQASRRSDEQYRLLFEANPQPMFVFEYGTFRILAVNAAAVQGYGYSREEFLSMTTREIRPAEDLPSFFEDVDKSHAGLRNAGVWRHRRQDGVIILVEISSQPLIFNECSACLIQAIDVTAREQARQEMEWQRDRLQRQAELIELSGDAIITTSAEGLITEWNAGAEKIYGWNKGESLGRKLDELLPAAGRLSNDADATLRKQMHWEGELTQTRKGGGKVTVDSRQLLLGNNANAPTGMLQINRDITAHKELEEQLRQAQKLDSIGKLAGGVAHDFNNLMTIVSGYAGMALDELAPEHPLRDSLIEIVQAAKRATTLTRQLLVFSRNQLRSVSHVDLNEVVLEMEKLLRRSIGEDIALTLSLDAFPAVVLADRGHIEQVILNLVLNARDALSEGGTIRIGGARMLVDSSYARQHPPLHPGWYMVLSVTDNGTGMAPEVRQKCFEPFFTTKTAGHGLGLGLSTVYGIVSQSDGAVFVESEPGKGSTFRIFLPVVETPARREASPADAVPLAGTETILVVEDEDSLRKYVRETLERKGYKVMAAASGREALQIARSRSGPIDLLLTDMVMPEMSGAELAEAFVQARPHTPVLRMTGYSDRLGGLEGSKNVVQKPFTPAVLLKSIRAALVKN